MPRLNIHQLKPWKELPNHRNHLIRHILAPRPAHKQRGLLKPHLLGVLEGKITQVIQGLGEDGQRHAELLGFGLRRGPVQVAEEEVADCEGLYMVRGEGGGRRGWGRTSS